MAHQIMQYDNMISVKERPWHGLGVILEDVPNIQEAKEKSGLIWTASIKPSYFEASPGEFVRVPGQNAVVRDDVPVVIGAVGDRYEIYQNDEMWRFIEAFQTETNCKIETAGSLRNGAIAWVLAKNGTVEYVTGDPVEEFFLFRNSFDGSSPIMTAFTNIRVVCSNTIALAIRNARNIFKVRHTASAESQLEEVHKALGIRENFKVKLDEAMDHLVTVPFGAKKTEQFLADVIFPIPQQIVQQGGKVVDIKEASKKALTTRTNKINAVLNLIETGAGADIAGVKGTAYGLFQALTEWSDHERSIKVTQNRDRKEVLFENAFWGTGAQFKQDSFDALLKAA
jgi:phage/plasmid-like protein (TIGR03299 family)